MFIRRLSITGFGCLEEVTYEFPPGGLLILGPNESGKSTLVQCIEDLLFGYQPREAKPWRPWEGAEFVGELELASDDGSLRIRRSFADNRTTVTRRDSHGNIIDQPLGPVKLSPGGSTHERALYARWLSAAIGMDSADLFRRTLYVPQGSLEVEVGDIDGLLRSYMTGGGLDVEAVARALAERRRSVAKLPSEGRAHPGELDGLRDRLQSTRVELEEARQRESRLEELRTELSDLQTNLRDQQTEHDRLADLLTTADRGRQLQETTAHLQELLSRDRRDQEQDEKARTELAGLAARVEGGRDLIEKAEAVRLALDDWERLRDAVTAARGRLAAVSEVGSGPRTGLVAGGLSGLAGAVFGGLLGGWPGALAGLVLGFVAGLTLARWLVVRRPRLAERGLRDQDLAAAERDLELATDGLAQLVPSVEREHLPDLRGRLDDLQGLVRRKVDLEASLLTDDGLEELNGQLRARSAELEAAEKELQALEQVLSAAGLSKPAMEGAARQQKQNLEQELNSGRQRLQRLREEAAELRGAQGRAAVVLADEVGELEEREDELAGRFHALQLAEDVWGDAVRRFQETYLERYTQRVGNWLRDLSSERYDQVRIHPDQPTPEARRARDGRWVPVDRLSQGAKDRLYLSLRLALAEVMGAQGVEGPLILDDPFVTFDAQRLEDAFETLRRSAERRQVILLAHDERYREVGWPVWDLPHPPAHQGAKEG